MGGSSKPKETSLDKALANIGAEQYNHYQSKFLPLQKNAISQSLNPATSITQAHNLANADYQQAFAPNAEKVAMSQGGAAGGGSGRQVLGLAGSSLDQGKAMGLGQTDTQLQTQRQLATNLQSLMNIGQGQGQQALTTLGSAADVANKQAAMDSSVSAASHAAIGNAVGNFVGAAGYNKSLGKGLNPSLTGTTNPANPYGQP